MPYLVLFNYTAPFEALDHVLPAHHTHLNTHYTSGHFLMSGSLLPREGGGILTRVESRKEIDAIIACGPFVIENLTQACVTAWGLGRRSADIPQAWLPGAVVMIST